MLKTTALTNTHNALNAKMVAFSGYSMPIWYNSAKEEHLAVRQAVGVFDVSHMGMVHFKGRNAFDQLQAICTNNIEKTKNNSLLESELKSQKEDNRFLKDIFVYKDFELNDIDPNKLVLTKKKEIEVQIETQNISKNKSNYSIQLGVFHYPTSEYKSLKNIYNIFNDNIYTYFCGDFNNLSDAKIQLDKLLKLGYSNIFIIENK